MREKIIIIRGWGPLAPKITIGEYQRINADYLVLIASLKRPETLPEEFSGFESDPTSMYHNVESILNHWCTNDQKYIMATEYINTIENHEDIKVIEGNSLRNDWFYNTVRTFHKNKNQTIINVEIMHGNLRRARINGVMYLLEEVEEMLKQPSFLG